MTSKTRWISGLLVGLLIAVTGPTLLAQDDEEESSRGRGYLEAGVWGPTVIGAQDEPATLIDIQTSTTDATLLDFQHDPTAGGYFRGGYEMHKNLGEFMVTWFDTDETLNLKESSPGEFQFGEILAYPVLAGYFNDGIADGFDSNSVTKLSDFRLDYGRHAFRSDRFIAKWFVGLRRVKFTRELDVIYTALAPPTVPLLPPVADAAKVQELAALPDEVEMRSAFSGRGPEVGMDFRIPLIKNKRLQVNGGFVLAILRGKIDSDYSSTNAGYVYEQPMVVGPVNPDSPPNGVMTPPYQFDQVVGDADATGIDKVYVADGTTQVREVISLAADGRSTTSPVMELYVALNFRVWRGLEVFLGFRDIYYGDVGLDLRPKVFSSLFGTNFQDVSETSRSVSYQGFYGGVGYRF